MPTIHEGVVTSIGKMIKTCTVTVSRQQEIPKILKSVTRSTKYLVHDPNHQTHIGDKVTIIDGVKYSLRKHFRLKTIHRQGQDPQQYAVKPAEWRILENRMKSALNRQAAVEARKEQGAAKRALAQKDYAARIRAGGVALDLDEVDGDSAATAGNTRTGQGEGPDDQFGTKGTSA